MPCPPSGVFLLLILGLVFYTLSKPYDSSESFFVNLINSFIKYFSYIFLILGVVSWVVGAINGYGK